MKISERKFNGIFFIIFGVIMFFENSTTFYFGLKFTLTGYKYIIPLSLICIGSYLLFSKK